MLRLKHPVTGEDTGRALALTTDGNHRWCAVDPRVGTAWVVAEAVLNLACVGARPLAVVNCLNFGNPEHPEVMWELSEAIDGMAEACRDLGIPVVGGNVSLYNESAGSTSIPRRSSACSASSTSSCAGRRAWRSSTAPSCCSSGPSRPSPSLAGSRWAWERGARGGALPPLDAVAHLAVAAFVRALVADDLAAGRARRGRRRSRPRPGRGGRRRWRGGRGHRRRPALGALFGESPSRVLAAVAPAQLDAVRRRADEAAWPCGPSAAPAATASSSDGVVDVGLDDARPRLARPSCPVAFGGASTH